MNLMLGGNFCSCIDGPRSSTASDEMQFSAPRGEDFGEGLLQEYTTFVWDKAQQCSSSPSANRQHPLGMGVLGRLVVGLWMIHGIFDFAKPPVLSSCRTTVVFGCSDSTPLSSDRKRISPPALLPICPNQQFRLRAEDQISPLFQN